MRYFRMGIIPLVAFVTMSAANSERLVPRIQEEGWTIAGNPDLGEFSTKNQEPVDFAIWRAADGSWQLWSCIRRTREYGRTRLFHRWEGQEFFDSDWRPKGIVMRAEPSLGETPGGLQAPYVLKIDGLYHMFYGDMTNICLATSTDGKTFTRRIRRNSPALFNEGSGANARDPMLIEIDGLWHAYYSANPDDLGAVYCRTTKNFRNWSQSVKVAAGGEAGTEPFSAECPFVVEPTPGNFYLFRTQRYGENAITRVYHSTDPLNFGIDEDEDYLVAELPIAAPEIVYHENQYYVASLLPGLDGIRIAPLEWMKQEE